MKLYFNKNEKGDILVQIEKGTALIDFDYVEMIRQLMADNSIEADWGNLEDVEKGKLNDLLGKICEAVKTGMEKQI